MPLDPEDLLVQLGEAREEIDRLKEGMGYFRPEVIHFALLMENELRNNDHKPGWKSDSAQKLLDRVGQELKELTTVVIQFNDARRADGAVNMEALRAKIREEGADVANMVMMVVDVLGGLPPEGHDLTAWDMAYLLGSVLDERDARAA